MKASDGKAKNIIINRIMILKVGDITRSRFKGFSYLREEWFPQGVYIRSFICSVHSRFKYFYSSVFHQVELSPVFSRGKYLCVVPSNSVSSCAGVVCWSRLYVTS